MLDEIGVSLSTAINIFFKRVSRGRCIPFEFGVYPFYDFANIAYLDGFRLGADTGLTCYVEHETIED